MPKGANNRKSATKGFFLFSEYTWYVRLCGGGEWKTNFNQSMFGSNGNLTSLDYRWHWIHFWDWNPIWKSSWLHSHWASLRWKHFLFRKWFSFHWKKSVRGQKFHKQFVAHSSFEFQIEYLNCSRPCTTHKAAGLDGIVGLVYTIHMERNGPGQSMQCCIPSQDLQLKDWQ